MTTLIKLLLLPMLALAAASPLVRPRSHLPPLPSPISQPNTGELFVQEDKVVNSNQLPREQAIRTGQLTSLTNLPERDEQLRVKFPAHEMVSKVHSSESRNRKTQIHSQNSERNLRDAKTKGLSAKEEEASLKDINEGEDRNEDSMISAIQQFLPESPAQPGNRYSRVSRSLHTIHNNQFEPHSNKYKRNYEDSYLESIGYDPSMGFTKKNYDDSYLASIGYDPSMVWAKKRYDDSYLATVGYDPSMAWAKKRHDDSYLASVGYDPSMAWAKKWYDDSYLASVGYEPSMAWAKKRYDDSYLASVGYDPSMDWAKKRYDDSYLASVGYDPSMDWAKKSFDDSYLQSIGYDPEMSWAKKYDDSYLQTFGYNPYMDWSNKMYDDSYLESVGYNPTMAWAKKRFDDDSYMQSVGYDPSMGWAKKRSQVTVQYPNSHITKSPSNILKNDQSIHHKRSFRPMMYVDFDDYKRSPSGMGPRGFHEGIFNDNFGFFSPVKRSKREVDASHVDTDRTDLVKQIESLRLHSNLFKRKFGMGSTGFHGDTFNEGWGGFSTMKKRGPEMNSRGFYGDTFSGGFGDFGTMKKRYNEMTSSGFDGDTFSGGFGNFGTMKKRRPEMTSSGFYGDTFNGGMGNFYTMKRLMHKPRPEMISRGFNGGTFSNGFGDFSSMKRQLNSEPGKGDIEKNALNIEYIRVPESEESIRDKRDLPGEVGDRLNKRRLEMGAKGFYGDTFSGGFGDFSTMKRNYAPQPSDLSPDGDYNYPIFDDFGNKLYNTRRNINRVAPDKVSRLENQYINGGIDRNFLATSARHNPFEKMELTQQNTESKR